MFKRSARFCFLLRKCKCCIRQVSRVSPFSARLSAKRKLTLTADVAMHYLRMYLRTYVQYIAAAATCVEDYRLLKYMALNAGGLIRFYIYLRTCKVGSHTLVCCVILHILVLLWDTIVSGPSVEAMLPLWPCVYWTQFFNRLVAS